MEEIQYPQLNFNVKLIDTVVLNLNINNVSLVVFVYMNTVSLFLEYK